MPLEVLPFGIGTTLAALAKWGKTEIRHRDGAPWMSDSGNYIVDLFTGPISNPAELDWALHGTPGVLETGLFIGRADVVVVAGKTGVSERHRKK